MNEQDGLLVLKIHLDSHESQYVKVTQFPFTLGRSIRNTFVLDRTTLSATHLIIEKEEEGYFLSDCGHTNGVYLQGKRIDRIKVDRNLTIFAGGVKIDLLVEEEEMEKTREFPLHEYFQKEDYRKKIIFQTTKSYMFILIPELFKALVSDPITRENYEDFLLEIWTFAILALVLAGAASLFSKIHSKKYQFFPFLWIANTWMGPISLISFVPPYLYFYLDLHSMKGLLNLLIPSLLVCLLIYRYSVLLFTHTTKRKLVSIISTFIITAGLTKALLDFYNDRIGNHDYNGAIAYPLSTYSSMNDEYSIKKLMTKFDQSFVSADKLREKLIKKNEKESKE